MPGRNRYLPFRHMLDHAQEAVVLTQGRSRADLNSDRLLELALVRLLEIIGEAASRVSDEDCAKASRDSLASDRQLAQPADPWV
jgi:uncharacterized protein with HEPN domain